jgi:ABC-2 type transport system permease protein
MFLSSGYSWPFGSLPTWLKGVYSLFPSTPYYAAFTRVSQKGAGLNDVVPELLHMVVLVKFYYILAKVRMKSLVKKVSLKTA